MKTYIKQQRLEKPGIWLVVRRDPRFLLVLFKEY